MPRHPDEQAAVMAEIGRPPVLQVRHHGMKVLDDRVEIEALERLGVVEIPVQRVGQGRVLVKDADVQMVRPPVAICACAAPLPPTTGHLLSSVMLSSNVV